jgi:hypothetical protein
LKIEQFLSYLTFYPSKKVPQPLIRVEKKIISKLGVQGTSTEAEFCADLKNVQKSQVWQTGKNFLQKN